MAKREKGLEGSVDGTAGTGAVRRLLSGLQRSGGRGLFPYPEPVVNGGSLSYTEPTVSDYYVMLIPSGNVTRSDGWYVFSGETAISDGVTLSGDVSLILTDGCSLTGIGNTASAPLWRMRER